MERIFVDQAHLTIPGRLTRRQSSSQLSDLAECPVCNRNLDEFRSAEEQEFHVKACLEGGSGTPQSAKYLVYNLPGGSALLGEECVICLEEFVKAFTTRAFRRGYNAEKAVPSILADNTSSSVE
ncbi:hypothetical protein E4T56_gene5529 [Termitomyces sp. T112]|nr:hypothetical protein E4T56_gene5529 [Termitomyces sp. T112]